MKDKWVLPVFGALTIFAVFCYLAPGAADGGKADAKEVSIKVKSLSFDPKKLEVHVGDSVVWTNQARTKHTAVSDDDEDVRYRRVRAGPLVEAREVREAR